VLGATVPVFSLYLTRYLKFSGLQTGTILSMSAVAAFVSPLAGAFIADRLLNATRFYGLCHCMAGALMGVLSFQTRFEPFLGLYLLYMLAFGPTTSLSNAIAFHHIPDSEKSFGGIRMWGTIGWIAVAWLFSFLWLRGGGGGNDVVSGNLPDALKLSSMASIFLGLYAFSLPSTPNAPKKKSTLKRLVPVESFRVMIHPNVLLLSVVSLIMSVAERFYYFGTAPYLRQLGFQESTIMPAMSLGQVPEVFAMGLLGLMLKRLGIKRVIALGILAGLGRFACFAVDGPHLLALAGISFHGFAFAFYFASAFIFLDGYCDKISRSGVHQLFAIITSGFGSIFGSTTAGKILDVYTLTGTNAINFRAFWSVPLGLSLFAFIVLIIFYKEKKNQI
jgi:nucleoside transporter